MKPPYPRCGWVGHPTWDLDPFQRHNGGYRAAYKGAPVRDSRILTEADMCDWQKARTEAAR